VKQDQPLLYGGLRDLCVKYKAIVTFSYKDDMVIIRIHARHRVSVRMKTVERMLAYEEAGTVLAAGYINGIIEEEF
jgi:2-methylisocitrate lyase-like PEP mutase family enzyme